MAALNGYKLTTQWFKFCDAGRVIVKPLHTALYIYCIYLCNKLHWKENFGLPTDSTMATLGLKNKETYYSALNNLVSWGFIKMVQRSINQHTANIICLPEKPIAIPIGTPFSTVTIVKRVKHKNVVNVTEVDKELTTGIVTIFKTIRPEIPLELLITEATALIIKFSGTSLKKDKPLFIKWAKNIKYTPPVDTMSEFKKIEAANKLKYGSN